MDRLETPDWVIGAGGLVLMIASFLPWYRWNVMGMIGGSTGAGYGWLCFVLGAGALTWMLLRVFDVINVELPFSEPVLYWIAGGLSGLVAVLRLLFRPGGGGVVASPHIGIFAALAGAVAVIVGGVMKYREEY